MDMEAGPIDSAAAGFSLLANPFAILGTAPNAPLAAMRPADDVQEAALRTLSVPRTRLAAEAAFLPGAADAAGPILDVLRRAEHVDASTLPPLAAANVRAHLCAAGLATDADVRGLAATVFASADVAAAIDADRVRAGMPPTQPAALTAELDTLADRHAAALVMAVRHASDPAGTLADLVRAAPVQGSALLRRATAAWARQTSMELSKLGAAAGIAVTAWCNQPSDATAAPLCRLVRQWAALSLPQRLADARSALDHAVTVRVIQPWRAAAMRVAEAGQPALALPVATLLAETFADLPGQAAALREEARRCAGLLEDQALEPHLARLRALVARFAAAPGGLQSALRKHPFGPRAKGDAGLLWAAFDAACAAAAVSEAPWAVMADLVRVVGGAHRLEGAAAARALQEGLAARAEQAGHTELAARLRAELRGLERAVATDDYERRIAKVWTPWWLLPLKRHFTLRALRRMLPLVDDPGERQRLLAYEAALRRKIRTTRVVVLSLTVIMAVIGAVVGLDEDYAANAPYRRADPQSYAAVPDVPKLLTVPAPAPAPIVFPDPLPVIPPLPHFTFPAHAGEREPPYGVKTLASAELRWCVANDLRLQAAQAAATGTQSIGLSRLNADWHRRCTEPGVRRGDLDAMRAEQARSQTRLEMEGEAMLRTPSP